MWNVRRCWRFALCSLVYANLGLSQIASPPQVLFVLTDGSQLTGTVGSQDGNHIEVLTNSFRQPGEPPVPVILDPRNVASCSMLDVGVSPTTVGGHACGAAISPIHSGLQQATLSLGYVGSAQRDESAKSTVTFAGYQEVSSTGSFRAQTKLFLNVSYDDKWKATPLSSNVTQLYEGLLTQNIFTKRTPVAACSSDDAPLAFQITGHAYHNNSQGIRVDQSYGFGVSKTFVLGHSTTPTKVGCMRAVNPYSSRLLVGADARSVNYILYSPGSTLHGVGTQFQLGYSRTFPSKQVVALTISGVPVYNGTTMSQASGIFDYAVPVKSSWAVLFSVADNYYEIAPKTFNRNYVNISLGIKFSPAKTAASK